MGAFLDKPKTEKYNESKTGAGLRYGLSSMQGWRIEMEDAHSAVIGIPEISENISWFAVFDGHAGSRVSAHCSTHLLESISTFDDFKDALKKEHQLSEEELMEKVSYNSYGVNRYCRLAKHMFTTEPTFCAGVASKRHYGRYIASNLYNCSIF